MATLFGTLNPAGHRGDISSLPVELFGLVLDEVAINPQDPTTRSSLARCARVASVWKDASLARLYKNLVIKGDAVAAKLLQSGVLGPYETKAVHLVSIKTAWKEIETILDGRVGVIEELSATFCHSIPGHLLFQSPSLQTLQNFTTSSSFFASANLPLRLVPFRLHSLSVIADNEWDVHYLEAILSACSPHQPEVVSLTIPTPFVDYGVEFILPLASTLTTLILGDIYITNSEFYQVDSVVFVFSQFLPLATSLTSLSLTFENLSYSSDIAKCLSVLIEPLPTTLKTLTFSVLRLNMSLEIVKSMKEGFESWTSLSGVSKIRLSSESVEKVEDTKEWEDFKLVLGQRGVRLVTFRR